MLSACGDPVYSDDKATYYGGFECPTSKKLTKIFDYILVEKPCGKKHVAKIHSIFVIREPVIQLTAEIQIFDFYEGSAEYAEDEVLEVYQTLNTEEIALNHVSVKPIKIVYVPPTVTARRSEYVKRSASTYEEHPDDNAAQDKDQYDSDDSFIDNGSEESDEESDDEDDSSGDDEESDDETESEDEEYIPTKRQKQDKIPLFFYQSLRINDDVVSAIPPRLLDLLMAYSSDPEDTISDTFKDLHAYVLENYFGGVKPAVGDSVLYDKLDKAIHNAIHSGKIDVYEFYKLLNSK